MRACYRCGKPGADDQPLTRAHGWHHDRLLHVGCWVRLWLLVVTRTGRGPVDDGDPWPGMSRAFLPPRLPPEQHSTAPR